MACDTGAKPIKEKKVENQEINNNEIKKEKNMTYFIGIYQA